MVVRIKELRSGPRRSGTQRTRANMGRVGEKMGDEGKFKSGP